MISKVSIHFIIDPVWEHISADAKDLISKMLISPESKRLSASEACSHPWIQKCKKSEVNKDIVSSIVSKLSGFGVTYSIL